VARLISPEELAELVPSSRDYVESLVDLGTPQAERRRAHPGEEARQAADLADVHFELVGDASLRGVASGVRLHRAMLRR